MTEEQIKDGYERLDTALHGPQDAFDRIEKRMGVRRRNRRIGTVAGAAVAVVAVGGYAVASMGSSDDGRDSVVAVDSPPAYSLVMTRPDGSTYEFEDVTISCDQPGTPAGGAGSGDRSRVYLSSPMRVDGERLVQPFMYVEAVVADLEQPRTFTLPVEGADGSSEMVPVTVFIADTDGAPDGNEVSSSSPSTGTVRVTRASCDPTPVLEIEVDATLGSEEQTEAGQTKQSLELAGYAR